MSQSNPISAPEPVASSPPSTTAVTGDAVSQAGAAQANSNTRISSLSDLKAKAPEVWQKMLEGIGMKICNEMREHQDRLKKIRRDYESLG